MGRDRYRYFRIEGRELLDALSRGILALERAPADRAIVARLLRDAHTLKGAARVVQQPRIGELAHAAEDALGPHREEGAPQVPRERIDALLGLVDEIRRALAALEPPAAAAHAGDAERPREEPLRSVRVDVPELDALLASALEAGVHVAHLRRRLEAFEHVEEVARALSDQLSPRREGAGGAARARTQALVEELRRALGDARRGLAVHAEHAARDVAELRSAADRLRLVPARDVFGDLERAARDAARALDRAVSFEAAGGDVRVDASVLAAVRDALLHAVRNAVAHGVEPADERRRAGKPPRGTVRIEVERRGRRVVFACRDDGRGIDAERVRAEAVRKGLLSADDARPLAGDALAALLLRGGLSTSREVNAVAGRGVGLDVVRDAAQRLDGHVAIRTAPGGGTTVEIAVPAAIGAVAALHVEASGAVAAVPLDAVRRTAFVEPSRVVRLRDGAGIEHEGAVIPFVPLAQVLGRPVPPGPRRFWSAVVVEAGRRVVAFGADRLAGTSEVVVRPLPAHAQAEPAVAGAALDAEGNPRLVLDPAALVEASARAALAPAPAAAATRPPILVVDDSLTTRMLEKSILESAGYEVELATSGEEALERARARRFGLYLVDVEMPGMDGLELVRATRGDPRTAAPAVLVTSRGSPEDRRRGMEAGASAYVVKSEFDQARLLATIERLLGTRS